MKKLSLAIGSALAVLAALVISTPAHATPHTTLSFSRESIDLFTDELYLIVDGQTDTNYTSTEAGCRVQFRDGAVWYYTPVLGMQTQREYFYNAKATDVTMIERFYLDEDCSTKTLSSPYTASASVNVHPSLHIPAVTVTPGVEDNQPHPFTTFAWNFAYGSHFSLADATACDSGTSRSGALPAGLSVSETSYGSGVTPRLILHGSTTEQGTFVVCMKLSLGFADPQYSWMTIDSTGGSAGSGAQLASTGMDARVILTTAAGSLGVVALAILGAWLSTRRRRS